MAQATHAVALTTQTASYARIRLDRRALGGVLASLLVVMLLASLDATAVGTALP
jgi:hypothetical protein